MKSSWLFLSALCMAAVSSEISRASESAKIVADSGPGRVSLIELYTSEGCSSCPPAEKSLAALLEAKGLWKDFVPVAFHVDYWDRLGWKDDLASPKFTERQHAYAGAWSSSSVYTPAFVLDGREWRGGGLPPENAGGAPGRLLVEQSAPQEFRISFFPGSAFSGGVASLAVLGFDRVSNVGAGENAGRKLVHQFAVLKLQQATLAHDAQTGAWTATVTLPQPPLGRLAVAAWVSRTDTQAPLQAAGGWISDSKS